jgi:hypothetical protein
MNVPGQDCRSPTVRGGNFVALLAVLDPEVALRRDQVPVPAGVPGEIHGAVAVAKQIVGHAEGNTASSGEWRRGGRRGPCTGGCSASSISQSGEARSPRSLQFPILHACADCTLRPSTTDKPLPVKHHIPEYLFGSLGSRLSSNRRSTRGPHSL